MRREGRTVGAGGVVGIRWASVLAGMVAAYALLAGVAWAQRPPLDGGPGRPFAGEERDLPRAGGPGPPSGAPERWEPTPAERRRAMRFLQQRFPEQFRRIQALRRDNPQRARQIVMRMLGRVVDIMRAMEHNPQLGEVMLKQMRLDLDIGERLHVLRRRGGVRDDEDARRELAELVRQKVLADLEFREIKLAELRRRIEREADRLAEDRERVEELVERRLAELLGATRGRDGPGARREPQEAMTPDR